jgi:hypothetical protein
MKKNLPYLGNGSVSQRIGIAAGSSTAHPTQLVATGLFLLDSLGEIEDTPS